MAVKTTGAEFKRFYTDPAFWPAGRWHDDDVITIDGVQDIEADLLKVPDGARVVLEGGVVLQPNEAGNDREIGTFEGLFKKWRKVQTTAFFLVECPLTSLDAVRQAIKTAGGVVKT